MKILLATNHLLKFSGSELTLVTLAKVLKGEGHQVLIYSFFISEALIQSDAFRDFSVTLDPSVIQAFAPNICYTQHHPIAVNIRSILPNCPIVHAILGVQPILEQPPNLPLGIRHYLPMCDALSEHIARRVVTGQEISTFPNLVDDTLFANTKPISKPKLCRIVTFSDKLTKSHRALLASVCNDAGIEFIDNSTKWAGSIPYLTVPGLMCKGDVVVASARGAIEAMLCGRVPLILADIGDDGLVTPDNFAELMRFQFSGLAKGRSMDAAQLKSELDLYNVGFGEKLRLLAQKHFGTSSRASEISRLFVEWSKEDVTSLSEKEWQDILFLEQSFDSQRRYSLAQAPRSMPMQNPSWPIPLNIATFRLPH